MPTCRICLHNFNTLKFQTEDINICTHCVNTLNESPEPARNSEKRFAEKLTRGMLRNNEVDIHANEEWRRRSARRILEDIDTAVAERLQNWITQLLAKPENSTRDYKLMRAHRRGLLRAEGFASYPQAWTDVAQRIRRRDGYKCNSCNATDTALDVHHIVYLSNHGTNQQSNLITLCRACHETEHRRIFDWSEQNDPETQNPIRPSLEARAYVEFAATQEQTTTAPITPNPDLSSIGKSPSLETDLRCPNCMIKMPFGSNLASPAKMIQCSKCAAISNYISSSTGVVPPQQVRSCNASTAEPPALPAQPSPYNCESSGLISTSKSQSLVSFSTEFISVVLIAVITAVFFISLISLILCCH